MRIAVIGATGNVGQALLSELQSAGHDVVGVARRVPDEGAGADEWVAADIARDDLAPLLGRVDGVVHLAWQLQPSRHPERTWAVNVRGTERLLEAVARVGPTVLVYASSVGAYSPGPDGRPVDESWPTSGVPTSHYSREKSYLERVLDVFEERNTDTRVVRLRPGLTFQRQSASQQRRFFFGSLFPNALARPGRVPVMPVIPGVRFQAVHASDVAAAYRAALERDVNGAFNLASDPVLSLADVAQVLDARPVRVPLKAARVATGLSWRLRLHPVSPGWVDLAAQSPTLDTARARAELGWSPQVGARAALQELLHGIADRAGGATDTLRSDEHQPDSDELRTVQGERYATTTRD